MAAPVTGFPGDSRRTAPSRSRLGRGMTRHIGCLARSALSVSIRMTIISSNISALMTIRNRSAYAIVKARSGPGNKSHFLEAILSWTEDRVPLGWHSHRIWCPPRHQLLRPAIHCQISFSRELATLSILRDRVRNVRSSGVRSSVLTVCSRRLKESSNLSSARGASPSTKGPAPGPQRGAGFSRHTSASCSSASSGTGSWSSGTRWPSPCTARSL